MQKVSPEKTKMALAEMDWITSGKANDGVSFQEFLKEYDNYLKEELTNGLQKRSDKEQCGIDNIIGMSADSGEFD
jgi:hypothetical protein